MSTITLLDKTQIQAPDVKPKKPNGKIETRAKAFADYLAENALAMPHMPMTFHVKWNKSRNYCWNPVITDNAGERCTDISGCGYDKLSACLSSFLHWIFPDEYVNLGSGAGVRRVIESMKDRGWILEHTLDDNELDVFTLAPVPEILPDPAPVPGVLPPDPDEMNEERAAWADAAIKGFLKAHKGDADNYTVLKDLLCDLRHWCDRNAVDFDVAADAAGFMYLDEITE